ncbi:uncharacterized protein LOC120345388 [Styela clava]
MARRRLQAAVALGKEIDLSNWAATPHCEDEVNLSKIENVKSHALPLLDKWGIYSLQYSHDGKSLAVGFGNGGVLSIDNETGHLRELSLGHQRDGLAIMALYHHPNKANMLLSAGASGNIHLWDLASAGSYEPVETVVEDNEINALDFSLDGFVFGTVGRDRKIRIYDGKTLHLLKELEGPEYSTTDDTSVYSGHTKRIFALKFHPEDNNLFITAGWDNCLKVWDKRMAKNCKKYITGPHICGPALDIWNDQVLTGSWRAKDALQLWDLRWETSLIKDIPYPHDEHHEGEFLYCCQFASGDTIIAGGSGTNNACAMSIKSCEVLGTIQSPKPIMALDIHQSGGQFAVAGIDGHLHIGQLA